MAYPVTLNGRTYTLADFEGTNYVDGLPDAFEDFVTHAGNTYQTTSTTSIALGTGTLVFTVADSGKPYSSGTPLRISNQADETDYIDALVTSYTGTTLTVNAVGYSGTGTIAAWNINIGGGPITVAGTLPVSQGGTGATTAAAAATALGLGTGDTPTFAGLNVTGTANFGDVNITNVGDISLDTISSDAGTSVTVNLGSDAGDDFIVGSNYLVVEGDTGNVGIGGSPTQKLEVSGTDARIYLTGANTDIDMDASANGQLHLDGNAYGFGIALNLDGAHLYTNSVTRYLIFGVNETEVMRVTNNNVGIGTTSTSGNDGTLIVQGSDGKHPVIRGSDGSGNGFTLIADNYQSTASQLNLGLSYSGSNVVLSRNCKVSDVADDTFLSSQGSYSSKPSAFTLDGDGSFRFYNINTSATRSVDSTVTLSERMRIDTSGIVKIANTSGSLSDTGHVLYPTGTAYHTRDDNAPLFINRKTSDGPIIGLYQDSPVGNIGTISGYLAITNSLIGLALNVNSRAITPATSSGEADNLLDIGRSGARWDDIYATNGTIQTSDANEKQQIAPLTDAEMTAAKAISALFKTFKWNSAVTEKGDAARTHAGVIAQDVQAAMTIAGLDAGDYAFFISSTWWETQTEVPAVEAVEAVDAVYEDVVIPAVEEELDEDGNVIVEAQPERTEQRLVSEAIEAVEAQEAYTRTDTYDTAEEAPEGATERTRLGIRYPELLAFVGAATEQRLANIETRLAALEA